MGCLGIFLVCGRSDDLVGTAVGLSLRVGSWNVVGHDYTALTGDLRICAHPPQISRGLESSPAPRPLSRALWRSVLEARAHTEPFGWWHRSRTVIGATAARSSGGGRGTRRAALQSNRQGTEGSRRTRSSPGARWEVGEAGGGAKRRDDHGEARPTTGKTGSIPAIGASRLGLLGGEDADEAAVLPSGPAELGEAGSHGDLRMEEASGRSRIRCAGMPSSTFAPSYRNYTPSWPARSSWCRLRRPCTNQLLADGP
jgi:hypothetical protein